MKLKEGILTDTEAVKKLALQHVACAILKDKNLQKSRETIKSSLVSDAGGYAGQIEKAQAIVKTSWVSERPDHGVELGGEYQIEVIEPVTTDGVGTGLFTGIVGNIRHIVDVEIDEKLGLSNDKAIATSVQIKISKTSSDADSTSK